VYWEKASDFATSNKIQLPIIGVDLPLPLLSQLTLDVAWVTEEEPWRGVLASMTPPDRKYAEQVREAVREVRKENGGGGGMFLYSVREARVSRAWFGPLGPLGLLGHLGHLLPAPVLVQFWLRWWSRDILRADADCA
jgi:hypothetical protein